MIFKVSIGFSETTVSASPGTLKNPLLVGNIIES
jgi:hypothetical protein